MPIDIKQLENATQPLAERIRDFLAKNPDKAYSALEIISVLEGHDDLSMVAFIIAIENARGEKSKTWERYASTLSELSERKQIREAMVQGKTYYADVPRKP